MAMKTFIVQHSVVTYLALALALSWGSVLVVLGPGGCQGAMVRSDPVFPIAVAAMFAGPAVAGILLTGFLFGSVGLRRLRSRMLAWRVDARWYAGALLVPPLLTAILLALSLRSPVFLPGHSGHER